ncbi:hypothetical protein [Halocola ammonii]
MKFIITTAFFLFLTVGVQAQNGKVIIEGSVQTEGVIPTNLEQIEPTQHTLVTVYCQDEIIEQFFATAEGKFDYVLNPGFEYTVIFSKSGYFEKQLVYNLKDTPKEEFEGDVVASKVTLHENDESEAMTELSYIPAAKCFYDTKKGSIAWDIAYQQKMNERYYSLAMQ